MTISVIDDGVGIADAHFRSLFEPFFSTKKYGEGMGLGLSVSYSLIKSYGGSIEPESRLGHGSTFRIVLTEYAPHIAWESLHNHDEMLHPGYPG